MKVPFILAKIINIIALCFLILGPYGIMFTGIFQVIAAILFLISKPKNNLIYLYFTLVLLFFIIWDGHTMNWLFVIPIALVIFLSYIIHKQKT